MTINEYLNSLPDMKCNDGKTLKETMLDCVDIWSNDACRGYCIAAMRGADMTEQQIKAVLYEMRYTFDEKTIAEAERIYKEY